MERIPVLVAESGILEGRRFQITSESDLLIGRADECEVLIAAPDISRQHARIQLHNDSVWVEDINSRNGVFVNEKRVVRRPQELRPGGKLRVGEHVFSLEIVEVDDSNSIVQPPPKSPTEPEDTRWWMLALIVLLLAVVTVLLLSNFLS